MELLFKRYFWAVPLLFIALASLLVSRTVNTYVGAAIEPAPAVGDTSARPSFTPPPPVVSVDATKLGHLFGIEPPPPPPPSEQDKAAEAQNTNVCYTCAPVKTSLRLQLLATMVANPKKFSMALINDLDKQQTGYFMVGDRIKQAVVYDIVREPQRVVIVNDETHRLEYIDAVPGNGAAVNTAGLGSLGTAPVPAPGGDVAPPADGDGKVEGVTKKDDTHYEITKQKLDSTLSNLNDVATQARIVPSFKNGVANGFKLFSIRPGSLYSAIGIQNGDVITRINGFDINSPDKALEIYQRLKDSRNVKIEYERRGQMMSSDYNITQ